MSKQTEEDLWEAVVETVVLKALASTPHDRFQTAEKMAPLARALSV